MSYGNLLKVLFLVDTSPAILIMLGGSRVHCVQMSGFLQESSMSCVRSIRLSTLGIKTVLSVLLVMHHNADAQITVTLNKIPGQSVTGGATVSVEAFVQNHGADFGILGYQIDVPCSLPSGTSGTISALTPTTVVIGNASSAASGTVPWVFAAVAPNDGQGGGFKIPVHAACRASGTVGLGETAYILPGNGAIRYLGTFRYLVSECASGTFDVPYEVLSTPCENTDLTRIVDSANACVEITNALPGILTVQVGSCCDGSTCVDDNINQTCCGALHAGAAFYPDRSCSDPTPCPCTVNTQCDDGQFCNGQEECLDGECVAGTPPDCPPGPDPQCSSVFCDPAANGGTGACVILNDSGKGCTVGPEGDPDCDLPDTCVDGICHENWLPGGTSCGDPTDSICDNPDTCDGAGFCRMNLEPHNSPCFPSGGSCAANVCRVGECECVPGCGMCQVYADLTAPFCLVELGDLLFLAQAYGAPNQCVTHPRADIDYQGGCPIPCNDDNDCPGGSCADCNEPGCPFRVISGGNGRVCCEIVEVSDVLAMLRVYAGVASQCNSACLSGACYADFDNNESTPVSCRDGNFIPGGMSESDCYLASGHYCGTGTTCASPCSP